APPRRPVRARRRRRRGARDARTLARRATRSRAGRARDPEGQRADFAAAPRLAYALDVVQRGQVDPELSAKSARLRYVTDDGPGIRRERLGKDFRYLSPSGDVIEDDAVLARIRALAIP